MNPKHFAVILSFILTSCAQHQTADEQVQYNTTKKSTSMPGPMTKEYRDIDTLINISLFNLHEFETYVPKAQKKKIIIKAANTAMGDGADRWLEMDCWRYDAATKEFYADTITKAPDCRLDDFHFMDIDNDGDLDILYSSLVDQYTQNDFNRFILLQNNNGQYKNFEIDGYLYDADFSKKLKGTIIFRTVSRPCCDYSYYNFSETTYDVRNWNINTRHVLEIKESKINEHF